MDTPDLTRAHALLMDKTFDAIFSPAPRPSFGQYVTAFVDEYSTDWTVTYDMEGERVAATEDSPPEYPVAVVRSVELGAIRVPLGNFGSAFLDVLQEHCQDHAERVGL